MNNFHFSESFPDLRRSDHRHATCITTLKLKTPRPKNNASPDDTGDQRQDWDSNQETACAVDLCFLPPCRTESQDMIRSIHDGQQTRVRQIDWVCTHHPEIRKLRQEHGQFEANMNYMTKEEREGGRKKMKKT